MADLMTRARVAAKIAATIARSSPTDKVTATEVREVLGDIVDTLALKNEAAGRAAPIEPLIQELYSATPTNASRHTLGAGVPNSADVALIIRVGTTTQYTTAAALHTGTLVVDGLTFQASQTGQLDVTGADGVKAVEVWRLNSLGTLQAVLAALGGGGLIDSAAETDQDRDLAAADRRKIYLVSTGAADKTIKLPATTDSGFPVGVQKADAGAGSVVVQDSAGGAVATLHHRGHGLIFMFVPPAGWRAVVSAGEVPDANGVEPGGVLSLGSDRAPFWDLPVDVLERALGLPRAALAGRVLGIGTHGDHVTPVTVETGLPALPARTAAARTLGLRLPSNAATDHRRVTGETVAIAGLPDMGCFQVGNTGYGFQRPRQDGNDWLAALHSFNLATGEVGAKIGDVDVGADGSYVRGAMVSGSDAYCWIRHSDGKHYLHTLDVSDASVVRRSGGTGLTGTGDTLIANCGAVRSGTGWIIQVNALSAGYTYTVYSVNLTTGVAAAVGGGQAWPFGNSGRNLPGGLRTNGGEVEMALEGNATLASGFAGVSVQRLNRANGRFTEVAALEDHVLNVTNYFGAGYLVGSTVSDPAGSSRLGQIVADVAPPSWQDALLLMGADATTGEAAYDALSDAAKQDGTARFW